MVKFIWILFIVSGWLSIRNSCGWETQRKATFKVTYQRLDRPNSKSSQSIENIQSEFAQLMIFFHHVMGHKIMTTIVSISTKCNRFFALFSTKWKHFGQICSTVLFVFFFVFRWAVVFERSNILRKFEDSIF